MGEKEEITNSDGTDRTTKGGDKYLKVVQSAGMNPK